jgi:hypothetical protein
MTRIERAQVISCLPSTRGVQVVVDDYDEMDDDETDDDETDAPEDDRAEDSFTDA